MTDIQNFAFDEHLVRIIQREGEPWFVGKDVCKALDIKNHNDALSSLDDDERGVATTDPLYHSPDKRSGGSQEMVIISEAGVYRLVFRSRKAEAEQFKRWLAHEVLPAIRRTGTYSTAAAAATTPDAAHWQVTALERRQALDMVREARLLYGPARARGLWERLPAEPEACLAHLLAWRTDSGATLGELITAAMEPVTGAEETLKEYGLRLMDDDEHGEGLCIASSFTGIAEVFQGTMWARGRHRAALRTLPGAMPWKAMKFAWGHASLCTFIPMATITFQ